MPELPEVETFRRSLELCTVGKSIVEITVVKQDIVRAGNIFDLVGKRIETIQRIGKYLLISFSDANQVLYVHLGMSGVFIWEAEGSIEMKHVCAIFHFNQGRLLYKDVRRLKGFWVSDNANPPWTALGMDALSPELDETYLQKTVLNTRRPVKLALLDQSRIAGIGNIYASEILFNAGINPIRPATSLKKKEQVRLTSAIKRVLNAAIDAGGTTLKDYVLSNGKKGEFSQFLNVYGKENISCPRCMTMIAKVVLGQRSTYFCPNKKCQK